MLTPRILLQGANCLNDLVLFGKATRGVFGIHLFSVCHDIENAAAALDQFDLGTELFLECDLQPGGTRKIVSADAVCNGDFHADSFMTRTVAHPVYALFSASRQPSSILEHASAGSTGRESHSPQDACSTLLYRTRRAGSTHLRANPSGADGIDKNSARRKLLSKESRHGVERRLARAITARGFASELFDVSQ